MDCDIVEEDIDTIVENSNVQLELENKLVSDLMESLEYESNQTKDEDYSTKVTKESSLECELGNTKLPEKLQSHERDLSDVRASQQQCRIPIIIIETEDEWKRREINDKTAGKCNKMTPPGDTEYHHYTRQVEDLEFEMRMEHFEKELSGTVKDDINKPKMTDVFSSLLQELESNMDGEGEAIASNSEASNNEEIEREFETKLRDTEKGQGCSETSGEISCDANSYVLNMTFSMSAGAKEVGQDAGLSQKEQKQTQVEAKHDDGSESLKPMEESMMSMISEFACGFNNNTPKIESGVPDELFNYVTELSNKPGDFKEIKTAIFDTQGQEPVFIQDDIFERQDDVMLYEGLEGSAIQQLSRPLGYNFDKIIEVFQELDTGEYDELGEGLSEIVRGNDVVDEVFSQTVINPKGGLRGPVIEVIPSIISKRGVDRIESDLLDDEKESTAVLEDGDFNNEMSQMVKLCLEDQGNCLNKTEEETSIWKNEKELWDIPDECNSSNEITRRSEPCLKCDKEDPINSIDNVATVSEKETGKEPVKKNLNQNELEWEDKREKEEQIGGGLDDVFKAEEENLISFEDVYNTVVTVEEIPHVEVIKDSKEAGKIIEYDVDALSRASCGTEDCVAIRNDEVLTNNQAESNIFTSELTSETDLKIDDEKREKKRKVGKDKDEIDDDHSLGSNLSSFPEIRMLVEVMPLLEEDLEYSLKEAAGISTGSFENTDDVMNFREDQIIFSSQTCTDMKISKSGKAQSSSRIIEDAENQKPTNYNKIDKIMEENEIERDSTQNVSSGERDALRSGSTYGHLYFASAEDGLCAKRKEEHNSMDGRNSYRKDEEIEVIKKNELLFCGSTKRQREQEIEIATGLKKLKIDDLSEEEATAKEKEELAYACRAKSSPSDNDKKEKLQINENVKLETRDFKHAFEIEFHHSSVLQLREIEDKEAQSNISTPQGNEVQNDQESREFLINLEGLCGREKYEDKETVDTEKNISTSEDIVQDGKENRAALSNCDFQREVHTLECSIVDDNYTSAATVEEDILSIMSDESMKLERHERLTNFNNDLIIFDDCSQAFQEETFTPCFHGVTNSKSAGNESSTDMDAMQDQKTTEDENCGNFEQPILDFQGEMKQHDLKSTENCGVASGVGEKCANIADVTFILEQLNELLIEKRETDNEGVETLDQENEQELKDDVTQVITQDVTQDTENGLTQEVKHVKVPDQDVTEEIDKDVTQVIAQDVTQDVENNLTQEVKHVKAPNQDETQEVEEEEVTQDVLEEITQDVRRINLPDHDATQEVVEDVTQDVTLAKFLDYDVTQEAKEEVTQDASQFKFLDQEVEEEVTQEVRHFKFLDRDIRREVVEGATQDVTHVKAVDHDLIQEEEEDVTQEVVEEVTQDVSYVLEHEVTQEAEEGINQDVTHRNVTQESEVEVEENEDTALGVTFEKRQEEKQGVSQEEQDLELEHKVMKEVTPEKEQVVEKEVSQEVRKEVTQEVKGEEVTQEVREKVAQVVRKEVSKEVTQDVKGKEVAQDVKGKEVAQDVKGKKVTQEVRKEVMREEVTQEVRKGIKGEEVTQELREKEVESKQEVTKENIHQLKGEISQNALPGIELLERKEAIFESENQGCTKLEQQPLELLVQGLGMNFKPQENGIGNTETRLKTVTNEESNQAESEKKINYKGLENEKETQDKFKMNLMPQGNQIENTETRLKREEIDDEGCEKEREEEEILAFQESEKDEDKENRIRSFEMLIHLETIIKELEIYRFEHDRLRVAFKTCIEEVMNNLNTMNKAIHLMETRLNQKIKDAHEEMKKCCGNLEANAATRLSIDTLLKSYSLTQHQFGNLRQRVKDLEIIFSALNINEIYEEISHEVSAEINAMDKRVRFTENDVSDLKLRVTELEKECSSLRTLTPIEERLEIQFGNKEIKTAKSFYKYNIQLNEKRNDNPVGRISDDCNEEMSLTRSSPVIASAQRYYGLDAEEV